VLQFDVAVEGKGDALFGELDDLGVGVAGGSPAVNVGGFCPSAIGAAVMEDADGPTGCSCHSSSGGGGIRTHETPEGI
jgi:hypothetical protein